MKIRTSELTDSALDWAVAKCEGWIDDNNQEKHTDPEEKLCIYNWWLLKDGIHKFLTEFDYSTDWAQGGPIIEREYISVSYQGSGWEAVADEIISISAAEFGPTPLVATMRCYVASKLGNEVEIPEELL